LEAKSENRLSENQSLASLNFPVFGDLRQSPKETTAVTLRLDRDRYLRLVSYGARFMPRRTNQEMLIEALDAYLKQVE